MGLLDMDSKIKEFKQKYKEGEENRSAYGSINGYLYQFDLTLYHILLDKSDEDPFEDIKLNDGDDFSEFEVESVEDYLKMYDLNGQLHLRLAQIKYHSGTAGPMEYKDAVKYLYYNYLRLLSFNDYDADFKAKIFHHDKSTGPNAEPKVVKDILKKSLQEIVSDSEEDEDSLSIVDSLINENHTGENMNDFISKADFYYTKDNVNIIKDLKEELTDRYSDKVNWGNDDEDLLYSVALLKIINDFRLKRMENEDNSITLAELDDYITHITLDNMTNFTDKISIYVHSIIEEYYEYIIKYYDLHKDEFNLNETLLSNYRKICNNITEFIMNKFDKDLNRYTFLNTIYPEELKPIDGVNFNTCSEWQMFLEARGYILSFIVKLAKLMYYYEKSAETDFNLNDHFIINDMTWIFKYPLDNRKSIIIADPPSVDADIIIGNLMKRHYHKNIKVWYFDKLCKLRSKKHEYRINITSPDSKGKLELDHPDREFFYVECLECLSQKDYCEISRIDNIFEERWCYNERESD